MIHLDVGPAAGKVLPKELDRIVSKSHLPSIGEMLILLAREHTVHTGVRQQDEKITKFHLPVLGEALNVLAQAHGARVGNSVVHKLMLRGAGLTPRKIRGERSSNGSCRSHPALELNHSIMVARLVESSWNPGFKHSPN